VRRLLITGAGGQLGHDLVTAFADTSFAVTALGHDQLDVADRDSVMQVITTLQPDSIVHAGAWTNVDGCETEPDRAYAVNALGTRHVANGARVVGAHVVYVSTDYVFDGTSDRPYVEWDATNPVSVYGRSKLGGERELDPGSTIVRTSWVCGRHGHNFVRTMVRLAAGDGEVRVVADQIGCPTFTPDLAAVVRQLTVGKIPGVFHATNEGAISWHGFAQAIFAAAGQSPERVVPITTAELDPPRPAPRPANSVLDNAALRLEGLDRPGDWHDPLERLVKELLADGAGTAR
jgi:dTDP-4-dehydrorhamnose reductase